MPLGAPEDTAAGRVFRGLVNDPVLVPLNQPGRAEQRVEPVRPLGLSNLVEGIFGKPSAMASAWPAISSWLKALSCWPRDNPRNIETWEMLYLLDFSSKDR